jgi:hypothetical protein
MLKRLRRAVTNWPAEPPSVEVWRLRAERDRYKQLAEIAVQALELTQAYTMAIGDVKQGAAREHEEAINHVAAIAANAAADLAELPEALGKVVTAAASMAAVQSASSIKMYNARLEEIERHLTRAREDIADLKMRLQEVERLLRERGDV